MVMVPRARKFLPLIRSWAKKKGKTILVLYGFGSRFGEGFRAASDIDLAFLSPAAVAPTQRWAWQNELADLLKRDVDLVDLRGCSLVMKAQIVAFGRRITCRDATACDTFETYVLSSYASFNERRREILADVLQRGSVYGG